MRKQLLDQIQRTFGENFANGMAKAIIHTPEADRKVAAKAVKVTAEWLDKYDGRFSDSAEAAYAVFQVAVEACNNWNRQFADAVAGVEKEIQNGNSNPNIAPDAIGVELTINQLRVSGYSMELALEIIRGDLNFAAIVSQHARDKRWYKAGKPQLELFCALCGLYSYRMAYWTHVVSHVRLFGKRSGYWDMTTPEYKEHFRKAHAYEEEMAASKAAFDDYTRDVDPDVIDLIRSKLRAQGHDTCS